MLMGEFFTDNIEMERVMVNGMDNLCRKLSSHSFQFIVYVPLTKLSYRNARNHFNGSEYDIWANFGPVGNTAKMVLS